MRVRRQRRNKKHTNIVGKFGFKRVIVAEFNDAASAFELEVKLICELKTHSDHGFGANFTKGGDGVINPSLEARAANRASWTDEKRAKFAERMRQNNPMKNVAVASTVANKISAFWKGRPKSEETKRRMSEASKLRETRKRETSS